MSGSAAQRRRARDGDKKRATVPAFSTQTFTIFVPGAVGSDKLCVPFVIPRPPTRTSIPSA